MSGAARRRGGRGRKENPSETSSRPSLGTPAAPPDGFDGPASRGSASGPGPTGRGRGSSNPPSAAGSAPGSQPTSPRLSQTGFGTMTPSEPTPQPGSRAGAPPASQGPVRGDPARDNQPLYTDAMRNIDLPPSFYNFNREVRELRLSTIDFFIMIQHPFTSFRGLCIERHEFFTALVRIQSAPAFMQWPFKLL